MAVDEALLESAASSKSATLRFYRWSRPTLSLGYFQRLDSREQHTESWACDVVRRSTGGGAIVHDEELTYSLVLPQKGNTLHGGEHLYQQVHGALITALSDFGVPATTHAGAKKAQDDEPPFLCFKRRASGDVVIGSHKVAGSAQRRRAGAVLQHGSVLLSRSTCAPQLAGISDIAGLQIDEQRLIDSWLSDLTGRLKIDFDQGELSSTEVDAAQQIEQSRYGEPDWTARR
jgi:lipoate-protein ligase A